MQLWVNILFLICIVIHECGHLVFGLLTGYEFDKMLLFLDMLQISKKDGRLKLSFSAPKRFFLGQCVMQPKPGITEASFHFVLFQLGGIIFSLITAVVLYIVIRLNLFGNAALINVFLWNLSIIIFCFIPMPHYPNPDGVFVIRALSSKEAKHGLYAYYIFVRELKEGKRMRDFDDKIFHVPEKVTPNNMFVARLVLLEARRLYDVGEYEQSYQQLRRLDNKKTLPAFRSAALYKMLYLHIIHMPDYDKARELFDNPENQQLIKQYDTSVEARRVLSAYEYLVNKNEEKGIALLKQAKSDIENELSVYGNHGSLIAEEDYCAALEKLYSAST